MGIRLNNATGSGSTAVTLTLEQKTQTSFGGTFSIQSSATGKQCFFCWTSDTAGGPATTNKTLSSATNFIASYDPVAIISGHAITNASGYCEIDSTYSVDEGASWYINVVCEDKIYSLSFSQSVVPP